MAVFFGHRNNCNRLPLHLDRELSVASRQRLREIVAAGESNRTFWLGGMSCSESY
jgi:hypothetical protein